jgi:hypothetical protein
MRRILYRLPDSAERVVAFVLWQEKENEKALLFVPPVENIRGATLTIAERPRGDAVFEDSVSSSFPLKDWSAAAMIAVFLFFIVKDGLIDKPAKRRRETP